MSYTYLQIKQIEDYIKEAKGVRNNTELKTEKRYSFAKSLDAKIRSLGFNNIELPFTWFSMEVSKEYSDDEINNNLYVIETSLQGILNSIPYYADLCAVRKDIQRGKQIKESKKAEFIIEISVKYGDKINFGKVVQDYIKKQDELITLGTDNTKAIFNGVLQKLEFYLNDICNVKTKNNAAKNSAKTVINVQQSNNQSVSQKIDFSFEDCFKSIDDCETINKEEIEELKAQIEEIQELLKDKKGKKNAIKKKLQNLLHFVADKGTDVMIALLPIITSIVQNLHA